MPQETECETSNWPLVLAKIYSRVSSGEPWGNMSSLQHDEYDIQWFVKYDWTHPRLEIVWTSQAQPSAMFSYSGDHT